MVALVLAALAIAGASTARQARAASDPIGAHSMLQLNDPPSFMDAMFAQAAAMHASAIRLDVAPALIFPSQSRPHPLYLSLTPPDLYALPSHDGLKMSEPGLQDGVL